MNSFSPPETLDMVASVMAACGAPRADCGSCCDPDCCGARGWSWAETDTTDARRIESNARTTARVFIVGIFKFDHPQIAGRIVVGQARRLLVAAALWAAFNSMRGVVENALRVAKRLQSNRS